MKYFLFFNLLVWPFIAHAFSMDEQIISTADKSCQIRYISPKTRHMWTIDVDQKFCKNGWVDGFATVGIKDPLGRLTETIESYFYQGYSFKDFPQNISQFYRSTPEDGVQSISFSVKRDDDLNTTFLAVARAVKPQNRPYSLFTICSDMPYLLAAHTEAADFKKSLFQSGLLKHAKNQILALCPKAKKARLLGVADVKHDESRWVFKADFDMTTDATTISYRDTVPSTLPKPTELRRETSENLLTIIPQKNNTEKVSYSDALPQPTPPQDKTDSQPSEIFWDDLKNIQSPIDLALLAKIFTDGTKGRAIVHVNSVQLDNTALVDQPISLTLENATSIKQGWYIITGHFYQKENQVFVRLISAISCQKDGCRDEH